MKTPHSDLNFIDLLQISKKPWKSFNELLDILSNNSPFLSELIEIHNSFILSFIYENPDIFWKNFIEKASLQENLTKETFKSIIRILKQKVILFISLCDLGNIWSVEKTTFALSQFADKILDLCLKYLFEEAYQRGLLAHKSLNNGYFIIAMGKWGALELNYSSDIDFIILYDPEKLDYKGKDTANNFIIRLSQQLIQLLEEQTKEGFVFRTDLRLRPDPFSFPIAVTTKAAEIYYQSRAETWERSAYIKARIAAGDTDAGNSFLAFLRPFIWRKHLDFASIQDIQNLRYRILSERAPASSGLDNFNIKLGPGGIREIEFFAQSQQLIWGGRNHELREKQTLIALELLAIHGYATTKDVQVLKEAYLFFRNLEHRVQLIHNHQTHDLPDNKENWDVLMILSGYSDLYVFQDKIKWLLLDTERITRKLFMEHAPEKGPNIYNAGFYIKESENDETTHVLLKEAGYKNTENVLQILKIWHHGQYRALRNDKTRKIIEFITHDLLKIFAETPDPDLALQRFDHFLANLPMGVQLFSLFQAKPKLLKMLTNIIGTSAYLGELLVQSPALFDLTLLPSFYEKTPEKQKALDDLRANLALQPDFQTKLAFLQLYTTEKKFQIGVHILEDLTKRPSEHLTILADSVIEILTHEVLTNFETQQGILPGLEFAILGFGSLGASEMTLASDLDLVFVYNLKDTEQNDANATSLLPAHYMSRFCKRLLTGFTSLGKNGNLYEVDVRLRPTGNSGPIIHTLASLKDYYNHDAWVWEIMALTKARIIYGTKSLTNDLNAFLECFLAQKRDNNHIKKELLDMRERIRLEKKNAKDDLMTQDGGIVDFNFLIQYLKLTKAPERGIPFPQNTLKTLEIFQHENLLNPEQCFSLRNAYQEFLSWRHQKALKTKLLNIPKTENVTHIFESIFKTN